MNLLDTQGALPRAASITHEHLLACLNTVLLDERYGHVTDAPLRILDAGCGDGRMMAHLCKCLRALHPGRQVELYGFDVLDHGVQPKEFMQKTLATLSDECPEVDWSQRVFAISVNERWPFRDLSFAVVLSNQVMEHVHAPERFLAEHFRVLSVGGHGIHLFPLKHYVYEGHLLLPWVHRIRSWELLRAYISALSLVGLGKYPHHRRTTGITREEFAARHADYIHFWTHYLTERELLDACRAAGFRACFRFTREFYCAKLRSLFGMRPRARYRSTGRALSDAVAVKLLRYASSVTVTLEKRNAY